MLKGAWEGSFTRERVEYVVRFDNMTDHHCRTMQEAVEFGEQMGGKSIYGNMVEVYKVTTVSTRTYELECRFDVVEDDHEEDRDFRSFEI